MSMKKLALAVALVTTAFTATAEDDQSFFAKLNLGYSWGTSPGGSWKSTGKSYVAGIEGGGRINEVVRLGLEFDFLPKFSAKMNWPSPYTSGTMKVKTYRGFFNVYADLGNFSGFQPYVTVGIGAAKNSTKNTSVTDTSTSKTGTANGKSKTNAAFKAGLGTAYSVTDSVDLSVHYQYVDMGKYQTTLNNNTYTGKLKANEFVVGVAYKF